MVEIFFLFGIIFIFGMILYLMCDGGYNLCSYERKEKQKTQSELNWEWFDGLSKYEREVWTFGLLPFQKSAILDGIVTEPQKIMEKAKKYYAIDEAYRNIWR